MQIWSNLATLFLPIWNDGTEVRVVGVADVLIEAGRDADAMGLLTDAQEVSILFWSLWRSLWLDQAVNLWNLWSSLFLLDCWTFVWRLATCHCGGVKDGRQIAGKDIATSDATCSSVAGPGLARSRRQGLVSSCFITSCDSCARNFWCVLPRWGRRGSCSVSVAQAAVSSLPSHDNCCCPISFGSI